MKTAEELSQILDINIDIIRNDLEILEALGLVEQLPSGEWEATGEWPI